MTTSPTNRSICFSDEDITLFSSASLDRNPLHLSDEYARKTPFANRVVFGILGGLFCLGHLQNRPGFRLSKIVLDFPAPLFVNLPYSLEVSEPSSEKAVVKIYDGRRLMSKVTAHFQLGNPTKLKPMKPYAARTEAVKLPPSDLIEGYQVEETYCPDIEALRSLTERLGLLKKGIGELEVSTLLWASYFVGMELPGSQALFSKLSLNFEKTLSEFTTAFSYSATLSQFDDRYNLLRTKVELANDNTSFATGEIRSFIRPDLPTCNTAFIETLMPRSQALKGKIALVTGASRGLGAAIAQALVLQGCTVLVNFYRSKSEAEQLKATLTNAPGKVVLVQGDASDLAWCQATKDQVLSKFGKLDFLVCNACPPILPLWLEPNVIHRVNNYVSKSLALMSVPMAVFLDTLAKNSGWNITISSVVSTQPPPCRLASLCQRETCN